ncbi:hypothetical protein OIN60_20600 [Paenibacillus sp. P96]|uniref:BclA C-terminal domain-containing protein n=1 Tax=Paenibacillus zeirhizosphaerae TaxID=2987519 RepID=A0ABT9FWM0_9BACL|nr:hypothetical protein [Paenibacillus sp. P96]MDP4099124.1 hypothetical protein [Paenibacillus sp. P96]
MTGITGPTGPTVTANNLMGITSGAGNVGLAAGQIIPVPTITEQNGTAITPGPGGTFNLAANQTYYVDYRTNANSPGTVAAALTLNGAGIAGTNAVATSNTITQVLAGSAIFTTAVASNLALISGTAASNFGSTSVTIIKLA